MYYLQQNTDRVKRTIAAMCIDSPAGLQNLAGTEHTWILNPHSAKSYVDALALRLAEEYYPRSAGRGVRSSTAAPPTTTSAIPSIGIPTVMPHGGYGVLAHHNSHDTPATVDPKSLRDLMVMNAAYTYFIASAGPAEKRWMAELALTRGYNQIAAIDGEDPRSDRDCEGRGQLGPVAVLRAASEWTTRWIASRRRSGRHGT